MSTDSNKPHVVVVHGVGLQTKLSTLKSFIDGTTARLSIPQTCTRAQLAYELQRQPWVSVPEVPVSFSEFNYARNIDRFIPLAEEDPRLWIRSCRSRLLELNHQRGGPKHASFLQLERVVDDLILSAALMRIIALRFHVETGALSSTAMHFIRQVQLYVDYPPYSDDVAGEFHQHMERMVEAQPGGRNITLAAHSLGTVVVFRALLQGARDGKSWLDRIDRFVTFGSPIDLILLLFSEMFVKVEKETEYAIRWTNYTFGNDPIASDLAIARAWVNTNATGVFVGNVPDEVDLGAGSIVQAHTDYWHDQAMLGEIVAASSSSQGKSGEDVDPRAASDRPAGPAPDSPGAGRRYEGRTRSMTTAFKWGALFCAVVVAWLILVWWEENLKADDTSRVVLVSPAAQLLAWVIASAMVVSHMLCWSVRRSVRYGAFAGCVAVSTILAGLLPALPVAHLPHRLGEGLLFPSPLTGRSWDFGNLILVLVPLSALGGFLYRSVGHARLFSKRLIIGLLVLITVTLSLFVGTRHNPSNVSEEFGLLSLALGLWWLGVLLARMTKRSGPLSAVASTLIR